MARSSLTVMFFVCVLGGDGFCGGGVGATERLERPNVHCDG